MATSRRQFLIGLPLLSAHWSAKLGLQNDAKVDWLRIAKRTARPLFLDASKYSQTGAHTQRALTYLQVQHEQGRTAHVVIGFHGEALARLLPPGVWQKLDLTSKLGLPANWAEFNQEQLRRLLEPIMSSQFRHRLTLLGCRQTFVRWTQGQTQQDAADRANSDVDLLPPAIWTKAMVVASADAQHAGLSYVVSTA